MNQPCGNATNNWISAKERLPMPGAVCLVVINGTTQNTPMYWDEKRWLYLDSENEYDSPPTDLVTHWMPLPDPPQAPSEERP